MSKKNAMDALLVEVFDDLATRFILTCPVEQFSSFERLFFQIEAAHWCSFMLSCYLAVSC